jgi:hypothetical protein
LAEIRLPFSIINQSGMAGIFYKNFMFEVLGIKTNQANENSEPNIFKSSCTFPIDENIEWLQSQ